MKYHHVVQVGGKVVAPVFIFFYNFNGYAKLGKLVRQIKTGLSSADDHYLLQISIFSLLIYFFMQIVDL